MSRVFIGLTLSAFCLSVIGCDDGEPGTPGPVDGMIGDIRTRSLGDAMRDDFGLTVVDRGAPDSTLIDATSPPIPDLGIDAAIRCMDAAERVCPSGCGVQICTHGEWQPCDAGEELCNAADDDCDGRIDETFSTLGTECFERVDGCQLRGLMVCNPSGDGAICRTDGSNPEVEICDGVDNDCDNQVDEDFPGVNCCTEDFHCAPGAQCVGGRCEGGDPPPGACNNDFECPGFEVCQNGQCIAPPPGGCADDFDCGVLERCQNGQCLPLPPGACAQDGDCPALERCIAGMCEDAPAGVVNCDEAIPLDEFGVYRSSTVGRVDEHRATCQPSTEGGEIIFTFQVPRDADIQLNTSGSGFDTVLSMRTDCGDRGSELACDDDDNNEVTSAIAFRATANTQYFILVDGYDGDSGPVILTYDGQLDCVEDAHCGDRGERCVEARCVPPPNCDLIQALEGPGTYMGQTAGRANDQQASCGVDGPEQAFELQLDRAGTVTLTAASEDFAPTLAVRSTCDDAATELSCGVDATTFEAEADTPYVVFVDGLEPGAFELSFDVVYQCANADECENGQICREMHCVEPGACDLVTPLDGFGQVQGTTAGNNEHNASCAPADGPETAYLLHFERPAEVVLDTSDSNFDTVLSVRGVCDDVLSETFCNDDGGQDTRSRLEFIAEADTDYIIMIDGYNGAAGDYVLDITGTLRCANDDHCDDMQICEEGQCRPPRTCQVAQEMIDFGPYMGVSAGQPDDLAPACGAAGAGESVFTFQLEEETFVHLSTAGSNFDTILSVRTDCEDVASSVVCNDDRVRGEPASAVRFLAAANTRYFVVVDGFSGAEGNIALDFAGPPEPAPGVVLCNEESPCEAEADACINQVCVPPSPVAACQNLTPFGGGLAYAGDTSARPNSFNPVCGQSNAPDDALLFVSPFDVRVRADTDGSAYDTILYVIAADCQTSVVCNDDRAGVGSPSEVLFDAEAGRAYYIVVDGYLDRSGPFNLNLQYE